MNYLQRRFWSKVKKTDGDDCWLWGAYKNKLGYGCFGTRNNRIQLAHRVSYELTFGPIPPGILVCHKCDNPPCVRPDHLFLGTNLENTKDKISKGRYPTFSGEKNGRAKLSVDQIREIRLRYIPGKIRIIDLAFEFQISKSQIWNIVSGREWNELPKETV